MSILSHCKWQSRLISPLYISFCQVATEISQKLEEIGFQTYLVLWAELCSFNMYHTASAYDEFEDDIPTQYVIQQSLQDVHKTVTTAENDRYGHHSGNVSYETFG